MYLRVVDVKAKDKTNGKSDSATINTSGEEGCLLVSFRIWSDLFQHFYASGKKFVGKGDGSE